MRIILKPHIKLKLKNHWKKLKHLVETKSTEKYLSVTPNKEHNTWKSLEKVKLLHFDTTCNCYANLIMNKPNSI